MKFDPAGRGDGMRGVPGLVSMEKDTFHTMPVKQPGANALHALVNIGFAPLGGSKNLAIGNF